MNNLAQFFKALSDTTRLQIIALLMWKEELCVCDIENVLGLTQSKASRHLRYLLHSGILSDKKKNIWVYYSINKNLSNEGIDFLKVLNTTINNGKEWDNLKSKLDQWLKSNINSEHCKIKKDVT